MKEGRTLTELAQELDRQAVNKKDLIAPASKLAVDLNPVQDNWEGGFDMVMNVEGFGDHAITPHAHGQLASFCDIPKIYHNRLLVEDPELLVKNVNRRLDHYGSKSRMVRILDNSVRAMLSDRYRPLDNYDLMRAILPVLTETPGLSVVSCEVTPSKLYVKAVTDKIKHTLGVGEVVQAGISITNSEIGAGKLNINPFLFFLACLNGMQVEDSSLSKYHIGRSTGIDNNAHEFFKDETRQVDDAAFWMKVRDTVAGSFNQIDFEKMVKRVDDTRNNKIEADPVQVVEVTAKHFGLNEAERTGVLTQFLQRGEMTQFGVQAAITRHSQDVENYDRATDLERMGGKVIELNQKDWRAIATAVAA
jgi:hypothetical protein